MKYIQLGTLPTGTRVATESGTVATLLYATPARARVRLDETVDVDDAKILTKETSWAYGTMVRVLEPVKVVETSEVLTVKRGRPPVDPEKRAAWDAANNRARAMRDVTP